MGGTYGSPHWIEREGGVGETAGFSHYILKRTLIRQSYIMTDPKLYDYDQYILNIDPDLAGVCGKEHYRMLAYLSTLFNHQHLIDIGTHTGLSAFVLAYNPTNVIRDV